MLYGILTADVMDNKTDFGTLEPRDNTIQSRLGGAPDAVEAFDSPARGLAGPESGLTQDMEFINKSGYVHTLLELNT
jgi:hypothetical protein